ncbi:hypothetical protein RIF29_30126 [Crotalaria pallida]|uniref:Uncharacterized protein n=1 Tax=Crotalaria pallida TaxID=3830 RepID=A0AAN9EG38_CROPI
MLMKWKPKCHTVVIAPEKKNTNLKVSPSRKQVESVDSWGLAAAVSRWFSAGAAVVRCMVAMKKVRWAGAVLWVLRCAVDGAEKREEEMRMQGEEEEPPTVSFLYRRLRERVEERGAEEERG